MPDGVKKDVSKRNSDQSSYSKNTENQFNEFYIEEDNEPIDSFAAVKNNNIIFFEGECYLKTKSD